MPAFDVTTNPMKLDPLKPGGKATIVVTATTQLPRAVTARAQKVVDPKTYDALVKPPPNPQRNFSQKGQTQDFPFTIEIPQNAQAGSFTTRFDVVDVVNMDDNFGQSSTLKVVIEVPVVVPPSPKPKKWLWIAIAAGVVVLGVVVYLVIPKGGGGMPKVAGKTYAAAESLLSAKHIRIVRRDTLNTDTTKYKANVVIEQHPAAGSKIGPDSASRMATLSVQVPFAVVPGQLVRHKPDEASNNLGLAGLRSVGYTACTTDQRFNDVVMSVNPSEGTLTPRSTTVTFYVGVFQATQCPIHWIGKQVEIHQLAPVIHH